MPPPPNDDGAPARWSSHIDSVDSVWLDIDRLDPLRIAINRTEYQGGSHGVVVGRWGGDFEEIRSPTDSDIRFGQPIVLRGDELWSHDTSELWHFRRSGGAWHGTSTDCTPQFCEGRDELGWVADVAPDGRWLVLDVWGCVAVFERRAAAGGGGERFAWTRTLASGGSVEALGQTPNGLVVVYRDGEGVGVEIVLYDEDLRVIRRWAVDGGGRAGSAFIEGRRVVLHGEGVLLVFDLFAGVVTHRLVLPPELAVRRHALSACVRVFGGLVCVVSRGAIGVYELA
ncbi:hypothetical protein DB30_00318 [Enhygromyxa salina]|uniref:NHL repeat protein n=1 Tax=Enhygromyxa salina TaxID=215803 RepID=A0A0C2A5B7_9BACT|nr:hypothetical protein DB30_00318 [Enhygromyxa salina]